MLIARVPLTAERRIYVLIRPQGTADAATRGSGRLVRFGLQALKGQAIRHSNDRLAACLEKNTGQRHDARTGHHLHSLALPRGV